MKFIIRLRADPAACNDVRTEPRSLEGSSASAGGARLIRRCPSRIILAHGDPSGPVRTCVLAPRASAARPSQSAQAERSQTRKTRSQPVTLTSAVASWDRTWLGIVTHPHAPAFQAPQRARGTAPRPGRCIVQRWRPRSATGRPTREGFRGAAASVFIAARLAGPLLVGASLGWRHACSQTGRAHWTCSLAHSDRQEARELQLCSESPTRQRGCLRDRVRG